MSVSYTILPEHNLHYVRYAGHHHTADTDALIADYKRDPNIRPGLRTVLDFSRILSAELDVSRRRKQMEMLYQLFHHRTGGHWSVIYFCPNDVSLSLTSMQQKMWEAKPEVDFMLGKTPEDVANRLMLSPSVILALFNYQDA